MSLLGQVPTRRRASFSESAIQRAFGRRVHELRTARGWTQEKLVDRTGLDRAFISQIENGHRNPGLLTIAKIALAFDVEIGELFAVGRIHRPIDSGSGDTDDGRDRSDGVTSGGVQTADDTDLF